MTPTPATRALTEAMARASEPDAWNIVTEYAINEFSAYGLETLRLHAQTRQSKAIARAQAALTALYAHLPGLAELVAGEAVVVPRDASDDELDAIVQGTRASVSYSDAEDISTVIRAASPYAPPTAGSAS